MKTPAKSSSPNSDFLSDLIQKGFKVKRIEPNVKGYLEYSRRDFYKIALISGKVEVQQAGESFVIEGDYLCFSNPDLPYSSKVLSRTYHGYACFFTKDFATDDFLSSNIQYSMLFGLNATPALRLNEQQKSDITYIFEKMLIEQAGDYMFKEDLIRSYINLLIHESLKIDPSNTYKIKQSPSLRITSQFLELLEKQFPIESLENPITLKTAKDFADKLSIHVNYLNRMVKSATGKTTTDLISDRIIREAKFLLNHTTLTISEISYSLGFEHITYFNNFFKKRTGSNPNSLRQTTSKKV